ncbi:MAG: hypothetical protein ICV76_07315 [Nitrospiraceae bacterium]|nr:hypothetical protein [Nitrospiraceae bacterium]
MIDWIKLIRELDRMALLGWLTVCLFLISPAYAGQNDHHVIRKSRLVDYSTSGTAEALAHVLIGKPIKTACARPGTMRKPRAAIGLQRLEAWPSVNTTWDCCILAALV